MKRIKLAIGGRPQRSLLSSQQGYLTLITVVLIVIVGFIAVALAYISYGSSFATINLQKSTSALYLAESGLEDATHELGNPVLANRSSCTGLSLTNAAIGDGTYTAIATGPFYTSSPTTLNGALTAAATSITVVSTANYQSSGRIMIDQELVNYTSTDATHFLAVQRGIDGTTATTHVTGTAIGQYQCALVSSGGAPTLTFASPGSPGGKRILNEAIQLQEGWAVGLTSGGNFTIARWNRPTERIWNNFAAVGSFTLNGVSMTSYVDGWAVGASTTFLHWNGSTWSSVASGLSNVTYNDVYCISKNNCHVVGNMVGGSSNLPTIADYNGTTWTATTLNVGVRAGHQLSIHCASPTDCWSVGNISTSVSNSRFYHWNGSAWSGGNTLSTFASGDFPFNGVFCPSTTDCWAVGGSANFARWNGTTWVRTVSGMPSGQYNDIFCNSSSDCWAVGNVSGSDLIIHWNGSTWSRDPSTPTPATNLNHVECTNAKDCWAVGAASAGEPSFIHYDGTSWTTVITTGLPNAAANSIAMIGPSTQPWSAWTEDFS